MKKKVYMSIIIISIFIIVGLSIKLKIDYNKQETENIKIDEYNFSQLEKVKSVLDGLDKDSYGFNGLKEFNEKFVQDIKPLKNCFDISNTNRFWGENKSGGGYVFGFKLYSKEYKKQYEKDYYIYPSSVYNSIEEGLCSKHGGVCYRDILFEGFIETISNPCMD
ncbi:MAG: hypothetical protein PHH06_01315 [Candidatus Gracilibacteria bacterium]|nr:hypothetical protein [Candidatus Gracilibacteria bacterium]